MLETDSITIVQGSSSRENTIELIGYPDIGSPNWVATLTVRKKNIRGDIVLSKQIEKDYYNHKFVMYISPSESTELPVGKLHMSLEIKNLEDYQVPVRKEIWNRRLIVLNKGTT